MQDNVLKRQIGTSDVTATAIGLGTWAMGGWMWGGSDETQAVTAIEASIDEGLTLIDSAPAYGMGRSETLVGQAIKGKRDKVIISTKCGLVWHTDRGNHFFDQDDKPVHRYLGKESIQYEVEQSLKRLGTDYIDHYITHWQDATTPVSETMEALFLLKEQGKIRSIGVSNVSPDDLKDYVANGGVDAVQEQYSMIDRQYEAELQPICQINRISCLSYSSLALGLLSGQIGPDRTFEGDDQRKDNPRFSVENRRAISNMCGQFAPVADAHGCTIAQLVIAWTIRQPGITFALCGARNPHQAIENAKAGRLNLSTEELAIMDHAISLYLQKNQ